MAAARDDTVIGAMAGEKMESKKLQFQLGGNCESCERNHGHNRRQRRLSSLQQAAEK